MISLRESGRPRPHRAERAQASAARKGVSGETASEGVSPGAGEGARAPRGKQ
jgi:hypothetical protein